MSTTQLNQNFTAAATAFENTLSRDGTSPNSMAADFDMNGNDILNVGTISTGLSGGATGSRPGSPTDYQSYFDTTLGHPIWYDGTNWVDATGTTV